MYRRGQEDGMAIETTAGLRGRFQAFWRGRSERERSLLGVAAAVMVFGVLYGLVYAPLERAHARLEQRLPVLRAEHRMMTAQVAEIERLLGQGRGVAITEGTLLRTVEASALAHDLRDQIQSLVPLGDDSVRVLTREAPLETWIHWLFELRGRGVNVQSCRIVVAMQPGQASLEAVLGGSGR